MDSSLESYRVQQESYKHFLELKNLFRCGLLSKKNQQDMITFLNYSEVIICLPYLAFAITLVSDKKHKLGDSAVFKVYDLILTDKKLHPLIPRIIFPNWTLFKQNRPEAIDLLYLYLSPQKIRINNTVHENVMIHYGTNFMKLDHKYQNRIFEYCLLNECENKELLKVFAKHHSLIRPRIREQFMNRILSDKTVKNRYFNAFTPNLELFSNPLRQQILKRISGVGD